METKELNEALEGLKMELEGKTADEVKAAVDAFKAENKELLEFDFKAISEGLEGLKEVPSNLEAMQKHLDSLDIKMSDTSFKQGETLSTKDEIKKAIKENFDSISQVKVGRGFDLDIKAVGDMTTANVSGDEERDFSNTVAKIPGQKVHFSDLIGVIPISGGTYTFPRELAGEGAIATQTEGSAKAQRDYDFIHVDVSTDFLAGYARYSKKMANNVRYLEGFLPSALRRDYMNAESSSFNTTLAAAATASTEIITGQNKIEMLMSEVATLEASNFDPSAIVVPVADYWDILKTEKSTGAGYGLPGVVTLEGGVLRINGIPLVKANWLAANKYYVGDWSTVKKVVTEGLSMQFSTEDGDNFTKNNITARIEAQIGLAIHRPDAVIYGDFTAV